jgi:hypothetical protein
LVAKSKPNQDFEIVSGKIKGVLNFGTNGRRVYHHLCIISSPNQLNQFLVSGYRLRCGSCSLCTGKTFSHSGSFLYQNVSVNYASKGEFRF